MQLEFQDEPTLEHVPCPDCGCDRERSHGFVLRDGTAFAIFFADWYPHAQEAWLDVILGPFEEPDYQDNVTFGCRIGDVPGSGVSCSLVLGGEQRSEGAIFGRKLARDEALRHPWLAGFWEVVDWLIINDSLLHRTIFHPPTNETP